MKKIYLLLLILFFQGSFYPQENTFIVGTKITEPFVIQNSSGEWNGISIDLWKLIAKDLNIKYEIRSFDLEGLTNAVAENEIDIAVSPLTITAEREKSFDFTHSYYTTGLSIAVMNKSGNNLISSVKKIFSSEFIEIIILIFTILFIVGFMVWLFERKKK